VIQKFAPEPCLVIMVIVVMRVMLTLIPSIRAIIRGGIRPIATPAIATIIPRVIVTAIPMVMTIIRVTPQGANGKEQNKERFLHSGGHSGFLSLLTFVI
jgi:hypothetical protein